MIKEIKYNGFTASPSDYVCPDGDLVGIVNALPEDGELHAMFPPSVICTLPANTRLVFLHETQPDKHYILYDKLAGKLYWFNTDDDPSVAANLHEIDQSLGDITSIKALGNTLIALQEGLSSPYYFLWKGDDYKVLGNHLPETELAFSLYGAQTAIRFDVNCGEGSFRSDDPQGLYQLELQDEEIVTNAVFGTINKWIAQAHENGRFVMPFLVRYAYRLYDGTLTMHSNPQLMIANTSIPWVRVLSDYVVTDTITSIFKRFSANMQMETFNLDFTTINQTGLGNWSDIIKSVDVFVSAPIYTFDQNKPCGGFTQTSPGGFFVGKYIEHGSSTIYPVGKHDNSDVYGTPQTVSDWFINIPKRDDAVVMKEIQECANFYLLASYPVGDNGISTSANEEISKDLRSLVSREAMTDDYDSHDRIMPNSMFIYNGRLNLAAITKRYFHGFTAAQMIPHVASGTSTDVYVTLNVNGVSTTLKTTTRSAGTTIGAPLYLYYPNTNAKEITLAYNGTYKTFPLKPHDFLNGSYYFDGWNTTYPTGTQPSEADYLDEKLDNRIFTSEVNNPFYFPVTGINTVGSGEILSICAAVKALSQGQFGQFPLYAFTTEGVWALETAADGTYTARQPVTRDVCINPDSITQLDDSVLFATDRGIMMLTGSNSICISDAINNTTPINLNLPQVLTTLAGVGNIKLPRFTEFLKHARMVYDYTGQRIIVFNNDTVTSNGTTTYSYPLSYVFSLKDKMWGLLENNLQYTINSYPEALAVNHQNKLVNLSKDVNSNASAADDVTLANVLLVTRPLKLDHPDVLKTVDTIIQRGKFDFLQTGRTPKPVRTILYGSRDLYNWFLVASSTDHYLRGFRGTPYKYFRIVILGSLAHDESIHGCTIQYTPRLTNQPR